MWVSRILQIALHTYPARALKDHNLEKSGIGERIQVNVKWRKSIWPDLHLEREVFFSISTCLRRHSLYGSDGKLEFDPCVGKIPWRREWQPTPVFLSGKARGQRSLQFIGSKVSHMT